VNEVIEEGYKRLDDEARRYMEALSVFRRAITDVAVDFMLDPFFAGLNTPLIRRRLARMNLINVERGGGEVSLHQIDMDFAYSQLPEEGEYCRKNLELRAAEFYEEIKVPINQWHTVHDVDAYIFQFEHLMRAEAYDKAVRVLGDCSVSLAWRGYSSDALAMHQRLEGLVTEPELLAILARGLANVYTVRGPLTRAIELYEEALEWVKPTESVSLIGDIYLDMGVAYRYIGDLESAKELFQKSLEANRKEAGEYDLSQMLHQVSRVCIYQGAITEGLNHAKDALARDLELQRPLFQGIAHSIIAMAHLVAQDYGLAVEHAQRSQQMLEETRDSSQGWALNTLGLSYLAQSQFQKAERYLDAARARGVTNEQPRLQGFTLFNFAWSQREQGKNAEALEKLSEARELLEELNAPEVDAVKDLADAIQASIDENTSLEAEKLLACARGIGHNPDLYPADRIAGKAQELADQHTLPGLAAEAQLFMDDLRQQLSI
jgi:tetratricopeptide (TPR) repeat protein